MLGIGDNIHQRAVIRELMKTRPVWLQTYYASIVHDLVADGLNLIPFNRAIARIRETARVGYAVPPSRFDRARVTYDRRMILNTGSLMAAQFESCGLVQPADADFRLPVPQAWRDRALNRINYNGDRPILVYRPIVLNTVWKCEARSPDPVAYAELFRSIRDRFFVVSVANVKPGKEWIVGDEEPADLNLNGGQLDFESLAGLFAEAALVFGNPGFAPILAQAVGTPGVVIYGGNERFSATNEYGSKFAPTLAIEPDSPCGCYLRFHDCSKAITIPPARDKVLAFVDRLPIKARSTVADRPPRTLIFATTYVDTPERFRLTEHWAKLHGTLNPDCDLLIVDSASPIPGLYEAVRQQDPRVIFHNLGDNIGHLSRGGRDGWGRAFCHGLQRAIDSGYDYAVHIEGDSLFRLPLAPIVAEMRRDKLDVLSVPVKGTRRDEIGWVETGLMVFRTGYVAASDFIRRYDWPTRQKSPTPERIIFNLLGRDLTLMPWRALRADKNQITVDNVRDLDWVTHCHSAPGVYDAFMDSIFQPLEPEAPAVAPNERKVNFGCGRNRLEGWDNYDADVDISKPLPIGAASVDYILAEHCVEHVDYYAALGFFQECRRILKPGGVLRVIVPSIEQIQKYGDAEYFAFTRRWSGGRAGVRGALHAILFAHGHKAAWTESLLVASLTYAGFDKIAPYEPLASDHAALRGVDGHHRAIGEKFNEIESLVMEASA